MNARDNAHALARDLNALLDRQAQTRRKKGARGSVDALLAKYDRNLRAVLQAHGLPADSPNDDVREVGDGWFCQFDLVDRRWKAVHSPTGLVTLRPTMRLEDGNLVADETIPPETIDAREANARTKSYITDNGSGGILLLTKHTLLVYLDTEVDARRVVGLLSDKAALSKTVFHPKDAALHDECGVTVAHVCPDNSDGRFQVAAYLLAILRAISLEPASDAPGVLVYRGDLVAGEPADAFSANDLSDFAAELNVDVRPFHGPGTEDRLKGPDEPNAI
jgi:hypothetical protein